MGHHGVHVSLETLRAEAGSTQLGVSARRLLDIARGHGFTARGFSCDISELSEIGLPLIAHFRFNHYLVVERVQTRQVQVNDPLDGPRLLSAEEFSQGFTGIVLSLAPTSARPRGRPFSPIRTLLPRLRPFLPRLAAAAALSGAGAICLAIAASVGGRALESIVAHRSATGLIALVVLPALAAMAFTAAADHIATTAGTAAVWRQTGWVLRRLARLPAGYFASRLQGRHVRKMQAVLAFADPAIAMAAVQLPALLTFALTALWLDWRAGAVIMVLSVAELAAIAGIGLWRGGPLTRVDNAQLPIVAPSGSYLRTSMEGPVGDDGGEMFSRLARQHALALAGALPAAETQAALDAVRVLLCTSRVLAVLLMLGFALLSGAANFGSAAALVAIAIAVGAVLDRLADPGAPARLRRAAHDFADLSTAVPLVRTAARPQEPATAPLVLSGVEWAAAPMAAPIICGVSIDIPAGSVLAIHGPTGSGKSVLGRLIAGDLVPTSGTVEVGGVPAPLLPAGAVIAIDRRPRLIAASIRDNLRLGAPIDDRSIADLLVAVGLDLPLAARGGLDLVLAEEGRELALSERYQLAIVRALLRRPAIMVLDDFFEALDPALACGISRMIRARGVTLVAIGRRLPPGLPSDQVLTLQ